MAYDTDESFLILFNSLFPLPSQNSWTGFQLNSKVDPTLRFGGACGLGVGAF